MESGGSYVAIVVVSVEVVKRQPESEIAEILDLIDCKLRKHVRTTSIEERHVQNQLECLLDGAGINYLREKEVVTYSSKTYRPDFTVDDLDLAIEVKVCRREGRERDLISEINDDILAYRTRWRNVIFVVYDAGLIRDVEMFTTDFERNPGVRVRIVKR